MTRIIRSVEEHALRPLDRLTISDLLLLGGYDATDGLAEVLTLLFRALDMGIISIELNPAKESFNQTEALSPNDTSPVDHFLARCQQGHYDSVVARAPAVDKPLVLAETKGCFRLYFQKYYYHESRVKQQIKAYESADTAPVIENPGTLIQKLYEPERALRKGPQMPPLVKDEYQLAAIRQALQSPLTIISGGPGTGKTTVVANLLRCLAECGIAPEQMLLTAPTGRAAQRMTETLNFLLQSIENPTSLDTALQQIQGQTLHAALGYRQTGQFRHSINNPLTQKIVMVDEASMVDVVLLSQFSTALDPSMTRLVLLGDPEQLPAVAAGSIFARLTATGPKNTSLSKCHVMLKKGYRSGSELTRLAQQVRQGSIPRHQPEPVETAFAINGHGRKRPKPETSVQGKHQQAEADHPKPSKPWCRLVPADLKNWPTALKAWAQFYQTTFVQTCRNALDHLRQTPVVAFAQPDQILLETSAQLLESTAMARILTLVRKGPWGCEDINDFLKPLLAGSLDQGGHPDSGIFAGMPIVITRNDRSNRLYNGDTGIVVALKEGYYSLFQVSDQYVALPISQMIAWEPALAITVHKSQGSEYQRVFLVLPDDPSHRLLSREMVYTAVTRARAQLVIWGDEKVLQSAVTQKAFQPERFLFA